MCTEVLSSFFCLLLCFLSAVTVYSVERIPQYNEHFACFPKNSLNRGFVSLNIMNKNPQFLGTLLNRGSTVKWSICIAVTQWFALF